MKIIFNIFIFLFLSNDLLADYTAIVYSKSTLYVRCWSKISSPSDFNVQLEQNEEVVFKKDYEFKYDPYRSIEDISLGNLVKYENGEMKAIPEPEIELKRKAKKRMKKIDDLVNFKLKKSKIDEFIINNQTDVDAKEKSNELNEYIKNIEKELIKDSQ